MSAKPLSKEDWESPQSQETRTRIPTQPEGNAEAHLIVLACGAAPDGYERWSLHLLRDRFVMDNHNWEEINPAHFTACHRATELSLRSTQ